MVTFTTVAGVHKAILAGYVHNTALNSYDSLLLQYDLDAVALDSSFGGFNGNLAGIAFGDGQQINVVGRQTTGRIVAAGQSQASNPLDPTTSSGLLLGYTSAGKLDNSFATGGYLTQAGSTALFTQAIDTDNRLVIAYRDTTANHVFVARYLADGSALDSSFNSGLPVDTGLIVGASGNSFMRVAVDSANNVIVAAVNAAGNVVAVNSYSNVDGSSTTTFASLPISVTTFVIGRLLVDVDGKAIVVGYDTTSVQVVIARTTAALTALDSTFNPAPNHNPANATGYLKYAVASGSALQEATSAMVHPDGRILIVGAKN